MNNITVTLIGKNYDYPIHFSTTQNYMGAYLRSKKINQGETWFRGNDLSDGPQTIDTLMRIIRDIEHYEKV
jgi:hypothetical protein